MRLLILSLSLVFTAPGVMALNLQPDDPMDREIAPGITQRQYLDMRKQVLEEHRQQAKDERILSPYSKDSATGLNEAELKQHNMRIDENLRQYVERMLELERHNRNADNPKMPEEPKAMDYSEIMKKQEEFMRKRQQEEVLKAQQAEVYMISDQAEALKARTMETLSGDKFVEIEDVQVFVDRENIKISEAVEEIVKKVSAHAGPWQVKWRLTPENMSIKDQRVNITAEASFMEFMDYLRERIMNMTGTQLFIKKFETSRVIVISDVY